MRFGNVSGNRVKYCRHLQHQPSRRHCNDGRDGCGSYISQRSRSVSTSKSSPVDVESCERYSDTYAKRTHTPAGEQRARVLRAIVHRIVTKERGRKRERDREKTATGYEEARNARRTRGDAQARTW